MPRTSSGLRTGASTRLAELERQRPEWRGWLRLLGEAWRVLEDGAWGEPLRQAGPTQDERASRFAGEDAGASLEAPLLHRRTLEIDAAGARRLLRRLASAAASLRGYKPTVGGTVELLGAVVRQDRARIDAIAQADGVDPKALASVAELAALPLLRTCGRLLAGQVSPSWKSGYCPICGSWPSLSERRGLDRSRRLRCGRCAADWEVEWLYCIYCGEREHGRLGSLIDEVREDGPKVETCATCHGYLKSLATLQAISPLELLLRDLETVELDLVALERGFHRPAGPESPLDVRVVARASSPIWRRVRGG
jgi:FdhE protein